MVKRLTNQEVFDKFNEYPSDFDPELINQMEKLIIRYNAKTLQNIFKINAMLIYALVADKENVNYTGFRSHCVKQHHILIQEQKRLLELKKKTGLTETEFVKECYCFTHNDHELANKYGISLNDIEFLRSKYNVPGPTSMKYSFKNSVAKRLGITAHNLRKAYHETDYNRKELINNCYHITLLSDKEPKFFMIYGISAIDKKERYRRKMLIEAKHNLKKYGYKNVWSSPELRHRSKIRRQNTIDPKTGKTLWDLDNDKRKKTMSKHYGCTNQFQRKCVISKIQKTIYGTDNYDKIIEMREKAKDLDYIISQIKKVISKFNGDDRCLNLTILSQESDIKSYSIWSDAIHRLPSDNEYRRKIFNSRLSLYEIETMKFLNELKDNKMINEFYIGQRIFKDLIKDKKNLNRRKHIDFYIPDLKLAFELNPTWTHMKDKNYHLSKQIMCEKMNISLVQIYQTDLDNGNWKNIIKNAINKRKSGYILISDHKPIIVERSKDKRNPNGVVWNEGTTKWIKESK